ncbi:HAAS signaling domain-containing protein [Brevibacterium sp. FAM 24630]|uniref:HAAS signaling domain-containing protein n=1 Tax=unclassified Brevibacterium TaxID=2614124 RepID=UPI003C7BA8D2
MSALTEIYVDNVVRHLPENTRADIAAEITATIDDTVEARLGEDPQPNPERTAAVEREVLEELGDPAVLSREYSNSPQHFIGPKSYPLFLWTLRWILPIVGLIAVLANVVVTVATTPDVQLGELIGSTVGNTVSALLTAFAVIAIIIGLGDRRADDAALPRMPGQQKGAWTIDDLDRRDVRGRQIRAEAALGLVFILALATIPFIPTSLLYVGHINHGGTFINPDLGTGWLLGYWGFLALLAVVEIIRFVNGSTRPTVSIIGGIIDVAMAVFLTIALLTQPVLHPEITSAPNADIQQIITAAAIWIITIWDQVSTWRTYRAQQSR